MASITIRTTQRGDWIAQEVYGDGTTGGILGRGPTREDAEAGLRGHQRREAARWRRTPERVCAAAMAARVLGLPRLREMRRQIQELYGKACAAGRRLDACYRASVYAGGSVSCLGRSIADAHVGRGDQAADVADEAWADYWTAERAYRAECSRLLNRWE
jgi:hypothetical protein